MSYVLESNAGSCEDARKEGGLAAAWGEPHLSEEREAEPRTEG